MELIPLKIGDYTLKVPIIQGGMGIGVSGSSLAAAVAREGGLGIISGVQTGYKEPDFESNILEANIRALRKEIRTAKENSNGGLIGVNFLVAMGNYDILAKAAVEEGIDIIVSGAGVPKNLPEIVKGSKTLIAPIVSSGKAIHAICKLWDKRYNRMPDLVVVEGPLAGGHLGYSLEELTSEEPVELSSRLFDVMETLKPFEEKYGRKIPVCAAGGIYTGKDIVKYLKLGASAVQMATRFIGTFECDAAQEYKDCFVNAKEENIQLVKSPVGMPGRAIRNKFIENAENERIKVNKCYKCLKSCNPNETPYCISRALINAVKGNIDEGLIFTGQNGYKVDKIVSVKELMQQLIKEVEEN